MLHLNGIDISLDRREPGSDLDFISHAHSDHTYAARSSKHVLASEQTVQLIEQAYRMQVKSAVPAKSIELLESGHMLGSKQLCMTDSETGLKTIYTGDFQTERSKTARPIQLTDADLVIIDSTYTDPKVCFDPKEETESALQDWVIRTLRHGIVLFSVYAMAKAQELTALLNEVGVKPVVSEKIARIGSVYRRNGIDIKYASAYDSNDGFDDLVKGDFVGITESRDVSGLALELEATYDKDVFTAVATGWAKVFKFDTDKQFPLSDHADFGQAMEYLNMTGAKGVLTYGSGSDDMAANLRRRGYDASPFVFERCMMVQKLLDLANKPNATDSYIDIV